MNNMEKGMLIVISGPSGVGKGTICKALLKRNPLLQLSISATTRIPRKGEVDGVEYYFFSHEEFQHQINNGGFLEYAEVHGNFYGTLKEEVDRKLSDDEIVILEIDIQGAAQVRDNASEVINIFIAPPSMEELISRIQSRGTENQQQIDGRMVVALEEMKEAERYDYIVINDNIEKTVEQIENIIYSEKLRVSRMLNQIEKILGE
jgi:guanylate kinase